MSTDKQFLELAKKLNLKGLTNEEVEKFAKQGLINNFSDKSNRTYKDIILENVFNFINIILFVISFILVFLGKISDAIVYISVALLNVVVGLIQEIYAKFKLDQIANLANPKAKCLRNEEIKHIFTKNIVVGDILFLTEGDLIPVDGVIIGGQIMVDESVLTGESERIKKVEKEKVFGGSYTINGLGIMKVEKVGNETLSNQITAKAKNYSATLTPLQKEVNLIIRILFLISLILSLLVGISLIIQEKQIQASIESSAVIVGIIPNSLFAMINLAYALGGITILRHKALVQKLNAIESLSHVDVLCLDKTGTITTKKMKLEKIIPINSSKEEIEKCLNLLVTNSTTLNATTEAIKQAYSKKIESKMLSEVEFSSEHKWSGIVVETKNKKEQFGIILGANEIVATNLKIPKKILLEISDYQNKGLRVLLLAKSVIDKFEIKNDKPILPKELEALGLIVLSDQIRENIENTLNAFKKANVELKIISGDNPNTVKNLAVQVGFEENINCISGLELDKMTEEQFVTAVKENTIFGRITPNQKEKIVLALKKIGKYVAMTGDGVNDVLAIKQADLGISLESGAQATRNIADIILLQDSFEGLPQGLIEGQKIRNSLQNVFKIYITRVIYVILIILATSIIGLAFPLTIKQNAVVATLAAGLPALAITIWSRPRSFSKESLLTSVLYFVIPASLSVATFAVSFFVFSMIYNGFLQGELIDFIDGDKILRQALQNVVPLSRTFLTAFLVIAGIIVFNYVPLKNIENPKFKDFDKRTLWYSGFIILFFFTIFAIEEQRTFWDLNFLGFDGIILLLISLATWYWVTTKLWQTRLIERLLGINFYRNKNHK